MHRAGGCSIWGQAKRPLGRGPRSCGKERGGARGTARWGETPTPSDGSTRGAERGGVLRFFCLMVRKPNPTYRVLLFSDGNTEDKPATSEKGEQRGGEVRPGGSRPL